MHLKGFSLIELVVFIVIIGIVAVAMLVPLQTVLSKSPSANQITTAPQLAMSRMEIILGQRYLVGFSSFTDLCASSPPAVCTNIPAALSGYTFSPAPTIAATTISGDPNYKIITVTVSGTGNAVLEALVASY